MNANWTMGEAITATWRAEAACRGLDPATWFPTIGERNEAAKAVCRTCPVRSECLEFAIAGREDFGVWGGLSEAERRELARQRFGARPEMARDGRNGPKRKAS